MELVSVYSSEGSGHRTVEFKNVFLYSLLADRTPNESISHKEMPTYTQHQSFVQSRPYTSWYLIEVDGAFIGAIYLTKNGEIGIHIKTEHQSSGFASEALRLLMLSDPRPRYLANINPANDRSIAFFKHKGFKLVQHTYELIP